MSTLWIHDSLEEGKFYRTQCCSSFKGINVVILRLTIVELHFTRMPRFPYHHRFHPRLRLSKLHCRKHSSRPRIETNKTSWPTRLNISSPSNSRRSQIVTETC